MVCQGKSYKYSISIQSHHWSHRPCHDAKEYDWLHDFHRSFFSLSILLTFHYFFVSGVTPVSGVAVPAQNQTKIQIKRNIWNSRLTDWLTDCFKSMASSGNFLRTLFSLLFNISKEGYRISQESYGCAVLCIPFFQISSSLSQQSKNCAHPVAAGPVNWVRLYQHPVESSCLLWESSPNQCSL